MRELVLDPVTRDLVRDGAGGFKYTESAATAVMIALSSHFEEWCLGPDDGSKLHQLIRGNDVNGLEDAIADEVARCLQPMVSRGRISILSVGVLRDSVGRLEVTTKIQDNSTGQPADVVVTPFGGF